MKRIQLFNLKVANFVKRFYLMMALVIISGAFGQFILAGILGFSVAISAVLGMSFQGVSPQVAAKRKGRSVAMPDNKKAAA
jgi:hypothetical protein